MLTEDSLRPLFGNLDELLEEVDRQGVLLARHFGPVQLAVILDIHALAGVGVILIILVIIIQRHVHPEELQHTTSHGHISSTWFLLLML